MMGDPMVLSESETVELKKSTAQLGRALKAACAFANHKGGTIYFGIGDRGEIIGQDVSDATLKKISSKIRQKIKPEIIPEITIGGTDNDKLIKVVLKEGNHKPYFLDGVAYIRSGTENVAIPPDELRRLFLRLDRRHWDAEICKGATLEDVDGGRVKSFLRKAKSERNFGVEETISVSEALGKLELWEDKYGLTNSAILLFGRMPQQHFLQAAVRCARFKGTKPLEFIDMKVFDGDIIDQVDAAEGFVLRHITRSAWIEPTKIERQERWEYPPDAVREAIVNAICHRDYESTANAQIRIFDDRIEIWGCGTLPKPLTPDDLKGKHKSIPRNPLIAKCFFLIKYIEQWGTGTNRMIDKCLDYGLPEPIFEEISGDFVVIFRKSHIDDETLKELNERQKSVIEYLKEKDKTISNKEYQVLFGISRNTAYTDLNGLVEKGIVKRTGEGKRNARYLLK
jgi:ATP-dependent DNA helicase RecG